MPLPAAAAARYLSGMNPDWNKLLAPYRHVVTWKSLFQLGTTSALLALFWLAMLWSLEVGYWLTLLLALPAAMMLVRLFMLQHDCGHGSFFRSQRVANLVGTALGCFTLVPYEYWRKTHAIHHATSGNLDHRSFGDIDTLTVREYLSRPRMKRIGYRLYRHPLVMLLVGPAWQFVLKHRLPLDIPRDWKREWLSVHLTNLALAALVTGMWLAVGLDRFLLVQLPITLLAGSIGVYLFYVQHQYEDTYWRYQEAWNYFAAGLEGASHLRMPKLLQWCTANIGLHHIHHVSSRIPNYHLQRAYDAIPELRRVTQLRLAESVKTLRLTLWDEDARKLVGFRELRRIRERLARELGAGAPVLATRPEAVPGAWR
ncbi:MAG TPA: fatty acid desaturase [Gemmatimonadales bacterium]|nr:fatty acid desaturase [Gemmatimonadales bacterium]